jgi:hypothetical protein
MRALDQPRVRGELLDAIETTDVEAARHRNKREVE